MKKKLVAPKKTSATGGEPHPRLDGVAGQPGGGGPLGQLCAGPLDRPGQRVPQAHVGAAAREPQREGHADRAGAEDGGAARQAGHVRSQDRSPAYPFSRTDRTPSLVSSRGLLSVSRVASSAWSAT